MSHAEVDLPLRLISNDKEFIPFYASDLASGADLKAYIEHEIMIEPGQAVLVPTGVAFEIPSGYEIQLRPRSGLALKHHMSVLNTPATIDADYRGEIKVLLKNFGKEPFKITRGMRIAQMVLAPVVKARFVEVNMLSESARGQQGFGHTGI